MRTTPAPLVIAGWLSLAGVAQGGERFALTAQLLQSHQQSASPRLAVELRNTSGQTQRVVTLTNLFEGRVYLRATNGETHEFIQTKYHNMLLTSLWVSPTVELAPGASSRWEHTLSDFVDRHRGRTVRDGDTYRVIYPVLAEEFQPACEIWCTFEVHQWRNLDERRRTTQRGETIVSPKLRCP
jgi:hypothetical protein